MESTRRLAFRQAWRRTRGSDHVVPIVHEKCAPAVLGFLVPGEAI